MTVFEPDVMSDGEAFDYIEYLLMRPANRELEIKKESPKRETANARPMPQFPQKELSNTKVTQPGTVVKNESAEAVDVDSHQGVKFSLRASVEEHGDLSGMHRVVDRW